MTGACESLWVRLSRDCWGNLTAAWLLRQSDCSVTAELYGHRTAAISKTRLKSCLRHDCGVIEACLQLWLVPDCIRALERLRGMIEGVAQSESRHRLRIWNPVLAEYSAYSQNFWRQILKQFGGQIFSDFKSCFNSSLTWLIQNHVRNLRAVLARFVQVFSCVMSQILLFKPTYLELYFVQVFEL